MNPMGLDPKRFIIAIPTAEGAAGAVPGPGASDNGGAAEVVGTVQAVALESESDAALTAALTAAAAAGGATRTSPPLMELRSLVVAPAHRRRGLGSLLVQEQLARLTPGSEVWLSTTERSESFYTRLGFKRRALWEAPRGMQFSVAAGLVAARLLVNLQLIVMSTISPPAPPPPAES